VDYITIRETAEKWGLGIRIVTLYCNEGRIDGAVKKGNMWLIPVDSVKPEDRRRKRNLNQEGKAPNVCENTYDLHKPSKQAKPQPFQSLYENKELFEKIIKIFPYPMHICTSDGTMIWANEAFLQLVKISDPDVELRKHNVLRDSNLERWGIKDFVLKSYQGDVVYAYDVKVPIPEIVDKFGGKKELITETLFHNMTAFPIYDDNNELVFIVTVFVTSRYYQDREEIMKGKEYIDNHWREKFDIEKLADAVHMSRYHYHRLFKQHTGMTPYSYYQSVKFSKLKQMLCDNNLSITQVFNECGMDFDGNLAKKFKQYLGMTPSQYRAKMTRR
jgi:AraC-like DNA-binding protein